jgi:hypothetical protein
MNKEEIKEQSKPGPGGNGNPGKKTVTIFVNSTPFEEEKEEITYLEVVKHAFADAPQLPARTYSVTYKRGHGEKPEGILTPGGKVKVKDQMIFDVKHTGQS